MAYGKCHQGRYKPINPEKYSGNARDIVYRSGWERVFMTWLDKHPDVLAWGSETIPVKYISPMDGKIHTYWPDMIVRMRGKDRKLRTLVIEIKPYAQTQAPTKKKGGHKKRFLREAATYSVNQAKWEAARRLCAKQGWTFKIMTEHELGV